MFSFYLPSRRPANKIRCTSKQHTFQFLTLRLLGPTLLISRHGDEFTGQSVFNQERYVKTSISSSMFSHNLRLRLTHATSCLRDSECRIVSIIACVDFPRTCLLCIFFLKLIFSIWSGIVFLSCEHSQFWRVELAHDLSYYFLIFGNTIYVWSTEILEDLYLILVGSL